MQIPLFQDQKAHKKIAEDSVNFGPSFKLNGITTIPTAGETRDTALIILNSGRMHRVGTSRVSVTLARQAAKQGFVSLRFDHSGIGDSEPRKVRVTDETRILEEIDVALEFAQRAFGTSRFVLFGLCSGAQYSFRYAINEPRVRGLIGIDNWVYATTGFYLRHYAPRLLRPGPWLRFFLRPLQRIGNMVNKKETEKERSIWPERPPRESIAAGYQELVDNDVRLHYIYTGSGGYYNYIGQMQDMFPNVDFRDLLTVDYLPRASHLMREPREQDYIIASVIRWLVTGSVAFHSAMVCDPMLEDHS